MNSVQLGRINKTKWYFLERESFLIQLKKEIRSHINRCKIKGFTPAIRLNGTSDISWERHNLFNEFKEVQFYDYSKIYKRAIKWADKKYPKNYHLTYSLNEDNKKEAMQVLKRGGNVSVVFRNKKLPKKFKGFKVINADYSDVRFKDPKNVIAGLYAKGKARYDQSGFVQDV